MKSALVIAAALALPSLPALAQPPAPPPGGAPDAAMMARHRADMARDLAIVLALRPSQQPALDQWLAAMAPPPHDMDRPEHDRDATTAERLQMRETHIADRQRHEQAEIEATKRFYASLDPRQKQVFDALDRLRHEGGHGPRHEHGPGGPGGPDRGPGAPPPPPAG